MNWVHLKIVFYFLHDLSKDQGVVTSLDGINVRSVDSDVTEGVTMTRSNRMKFRLNTIVLAIFPNLCLWQRSLCSNFGGIDPEKLYRVTLTRFLLCDELSPISSYQFAYIWLSQSKKSKNPNSLFKWRFFFFFFFGGGGLSFSRFFWRGWRVWVFGFEALTPSAPYIDRSLSPRAKLCKMAWKYSFELIELVINKAPEASNSV